MYNKVKTLSYASYIESQRLIRAYLSKVLKDPVCRHEKYTKISEKYKAGLLQLYLQNKKKLCEIRNFAYFVLVCFI